MPLTGNANLARLAPLYQMMLMASSIPAHSRSGKLCDRSSHTHRTVRLIKAPTYVVLFFASLCCGLWLTTALVGCVRNARTYRFIRPAGAPPPRLGWVWSGGRETAGGPAATTAEARHGAAGRGSDRSDLATISAPARRSHRSWGCAARDAFLSSPLSPPPSHHLLARN